MVNFLLDPGMVPFTAALAFVAGLVIAELISSLLGSSLMGDADAPDFDADADFIDADIADPAMGGAGTSGVDFASAHVEAGETLDGGAETAEPGAEASGVFVWLGFGEVPFILWLAGMLTGFGLVGYGLQITAESFLGQTLPAWAAVTIALIPSLSLGRWFARTLGRTVPKTETTALARRSLGDRRGVIAQGTAQRGRPAQARVRDGHGNLHYVRVEPVDDDAALPPGTDIWIRGGRNNVLLALPIGDPPKVNS